MSGIPDKPIERIADRLRGRRLLVTGVTGLLAKVFLEKLLRSVPEIGRIHLLVRPRSSDGLSSEQRVQREVLGSSVFDRLRALLGPRFDDVCSDKIRVVSGDLTRPQFGLPDDDYKALASEIDIVINSAATVTFDERLDLARSLNALGPTRLLQFARDCGNVPFMQVSTCYVSGRRTGDIHEELVGVPDGSDVDLDALLEEMKAACDRIHADASATGELLRRRLVAAGMDLAHRYEWNDTYTITKWLGEQLVNRDRGDVPVVLLRPAIIEGSLDEPVPGWIDGLRMADPMIIAYGRGKLVEFPGDIAAPIDIIPVDLVANAMIAAIQVPGTEPGLSIYQVCSSGRNMMLVSEIAEYLTEGFRRRPMLDEDGKPITMQPFRLTTSESYGRHWNRQLERAQAYRQRLVRRNAPPAQRREIGSAIAQIEQLLYFANIYAPYTHLVCSFRDDRLCELAAGLHPDDRGLFPFDAAAIDWREYIVNRHISGLRKFVLSATREGRQPIPLPEDAMPRDVSVQASFREAETIFGAFERTALHCGEKVALQVSHRRRWLRYTYDETLRATATVTRRFHEFGLRPGDRVALVAENSPAWGITYLAAMRAGLTAVPLDPQLPPDDIAACALYVDAGLICCGRGKTEGIRRALAAAADADKSSGDGTTSNDNAGPPVVELGEPFIPPPGASRDPAPPCPTVLPDDVASILFTSGTTVAPKAVQLTQANLLFNARAIATAQPLGARDSFLSVLPLHHAFEFTAGFVIPLTAGATITYVDQLKGPEILEAMHATGTTVMLVVPRLLKLFHDSILRKVEEAGRVAKTGFSLFGTASDLSRGALAKVLFRKVHQQFGGHLRLFVSGGSALDPELHRAFSRMGFVVAEGYGLTETGPVVTVNPPDGGKAGSVGKALPGVDLDLRELNPEGIGTLWVRGANVMKGYLKNPEATAAVLQDGWFRTGDLCRFDSDNYLYVVGRLTDTIVTDSGKNVYPDEVEVRYRELPCVKEMCVLGIRPAGGTGEAVHAVIVPDYESATDLDPSTVERTIRDAVSSLGESVPSHQRIQAVHFWQRELPKTSTLKAKRNEIRASILNRESTRAAAVETTEEPSRPRPPVEWSPGHRVVVEILAAAAHHPFESIRPESRLLLDLGLDSLMKLYAIAEIEGRFDVRCPDSVASDLSQVSDVTRWIGDRKPSATAARGERSWRARLRHAPDGAANGGGSNGQAPRSAAVLRWAARGGISAFLKSYVRVRAEGLANIPRRGGFLIVANHASHLDALSVQTAMSSQRRLYVAAAEDYFFGTRLRRFVFGELLDAIPFDRLSEGVAGLRRCLEILDRGEGVLILPEGTRSLSGEIQPFKIGAAVLAIESGVPVVPARILNAYELLPKGNVVVRPGVIRVVFGEPLSPKAWRCEDGIDAQFKQYQALTRELQERVERLGVGAAAGAGS